MAAIVIAISLKFGSVRQVLSPRSRHPLYNRVRHSRSKNELGLVVHGVAASNVSGKLKLVEDLQQVTAFVVTCFFDLLTL